MREPDPSDHVLHKGAASSPRDTRPTAEQMGEWSFPASDAPATWTWDVEASSMRAEPSTDTPVVVVGFDGSPAGERAIDRAATLLKGTSGKLIVVHAIHSSVSSGALPQPILDAPGPVERRLIMEQARDRADASSVHAEVFERDGAPTDVLLEVASEASADMLVVGRAGQSYVARALLGSTAQNVVRTAPCDVLVVR
jgi:nucleotide-binding universal stress UspA family protein